MLSFKFKISILAALVLLVAGIYFAITQLSVPVEQDLMSDFKAAPAVPSGKQDATSGIAPVDELLVGLKQRLETQPDDVDGWVLLSKSYYHLDQWKQAEEAFEKAKALGYTGSWQPLPRIDAFSQNDFSSKNFKPAINFRDYKANADINQAAGQATVAASPTDENKSAGLSLKVSLTPALKEGLSPDSAVFVFVRAVENPGPPLAVVLKKVAELPFEIALNDSHAMIPGRTISSAEKIIVGARISVSGNPERQPGDYEVLSDSIPSNFGDTLELVINDKI